jgi:hypothetical protein
LDGATDLPTLLSAKRQRVKVAVAQAFAQALDMSIPLQSRLGT